MRELRNRETGTMRFSVVGRLARLVRNVGQRGSFLSGYARRRLALYNMKTVANRPKMPRYAERCQTPQLLKSKDYSESGKAKKGGKPKVLPEVDSPPAPAAVSTTRMGAISLPPAVISARKLTISVYHLGVFRKLLPELFFVGD